MSPSHAPIPWWKILLASGLAISSWTASVPRHPCLPCVGCDAIGGGSSDDSCGTGTMLSISATSTDGVCTGDQPSCVGSPCGAVVTRTWDGVPSGVDVDHCTKLDTQLVKVCESPPPTSNGTGSQSDNRPYRIGCGHNITCYLIVDSPCHAAASVTISCTSCN
jgi:hypothetical protein